MPDTIIFIAVMAVVTIMLYHAIPAALKTARVAVSIGLSIALGYALTDFICTHVGLNALSLTEIISKVESLF